MFFGQTAAPPQALHSRKSGQRMFSRQHLKARRALASAKKGIKCSERVASRVQFRPAVRFHSLISCA